MLPNIAPRPTMASDKAPLRKLRMPRLGWLELVVTAQTLLPAMMFVPALLPIRFVTRVASFLLPMAAWAAYVIAGRRVAGGRVYPPARLLAAAAIWLVVSAVANPWINTYASAFAAVVVSFGVLCPAFWAPAAITDRRQLPRLISLLLLCNGASALMGIAQVYRPDTFRPPKIAMFENDPDKELEMTLEDDAGRKFLRPPGLTDSPGGAAIGGQAACALGLGVALMAGPWWWRGLGLCLAGAGVTVMLFSQVRISLITVVLALIFWGFLLALRGEFKKLSTLAVLGVVLGVVVVTWIVRSGSSVVLKRFGELVEDRATTVYYKNRGALIEHALFEVLPRYPLGAGPGRVGLASSMFGNPVAPPDRRILYAETQIDAWITDGGLPLLLLYSVALVLAFAFAIGTTLRCPDPDVAYWSGVVVVYGVAITAAAFGSYAFTSPLGVQFWALFGAVFGARERARVDSLRAGAAK